MMNNMVNFDENEPIPYSLAERIKAMPSEQGYHNGWNVKYGFKSECINGIWYVTMVIETPAGEFGVRNSPEDTEMLSALWLNQATLTREYRRETQGTE